MAEKEIKKSNVFCASCDSPLIGKYCSECGEKKLNPQKDFSLVSFLEQSVDAFTHFDSKFFKSFGYLISRPGFLTSEFIAGRRVKYMKPIQIFIITIVIFFLFFPHSVTYFSGIAELQNGYNNHSLIQNMFHYDPNIIIQEKIKSDNTNLEEINKLHVAHGVTSSKAFIVLMVPFLALFSFLLNFQKTNYFVPHIVFALHFFAVFLLMDMVFLKVLFSLGYKSVSDKQFIPLIFSFYLYLLLAIRKVFNNSWGLAVIKSTILCCLLILLIITYRQIIGIYTLEIL